MARIMRQGEGVSLAIVRRRTSCSLTAVLLIAGLVPGGSRAGLAAPTRPATQPTTRHTGEDEVGTVGTAVYAGGELLRNYRPEPSLVTKQTRMDKPKFPVIDVHCHWTLREDPKALLRAMDDLGVTRAVNLSGGYGPGLEAMLERFHPAAPDRLLVFGNLDFGRIDDGSFGADAAAALQRAKAKGVCGLKVFKDLGLTVKDGSGRVVPVDDPRLEPVWSACGKLKLPVLIHSADPVAFFRPVDARNERWTQLKRHPDWSFYGPGFPRYDEVLAQHNRVIERHPDTVFISAHLANSGEDLTKLSGWLDRYPNLYVDVSGRVSELGRQPYAARRFLLKYQDRVLFGTDRYPGRPDQPRYRVYYRFLETDDEYFNYYDHPFPPEGEWKIYGVFLPDDVLKKIYHENAERALAGLPPKAESSKAGLPKPEWPKAGERHAPGG